MHHLEFQPEMIGRDNEFAELQSYMDGASQGRGSAVFIAGEAGIGKTRLINDLKEKAQSKGFQVMMGNCVYESHTPYLPLMEALRSGGMDHLFTEETPRVESVFLTTPSGLLIKEVTRQESNLNPDIFASMLTTVGNFVKESLSILSGERKEGALNTLGYENYRIIIESGKNLNLAVILTGSENEFLVKEMRERLLLVDDRYANTLKDWDGDEKKAEGIESFIMPLITSGKYDGIYHGREDPKARKNLLFENVFMGLSRHSKNTPTLLCIEDMQWADKSSLALMHYIARNAKDNGLLILGTYRPEEVFVKEGRGHPLTETMQLMDRVDLYEQVSLKRLPRELMTEFLSSLLGQNELEEEFEDRIFRENEGNPLFIIQLVKFLVKEDVIVNQKGTWVLGKGLHEINVPSKIYNVIARRLTRVDEKHKRVLNFASVIGETFTSSVLAHALDMKKIDLLEQLRNLEKNVRLIRSLNGKYRFDHAKIKEVLYNEIPIDVRKDYHAIIANSIETIGKEHLDDVFDELVYHYEHCDNKDKAHFYLLEAAKKAKKE